MEIHVLTPLFRVYLVPTLVYYLEPMDIQWYPIMTPSEITTFDKDWIHPVHVNELPPKAQCCQKFNAFLDLHEIIDDDYYAFMCDDNMYEPGFFDVIRQQSAKILICALYRGDATPNDNVVDKHPTNTLKATKLSHIIPGRIDYAQFIIKGSLFKTHPFDPYVGCSDGRYIRNLAREYPHDVTFLPNLYALFNYFQPGRYNKKERFPKPNWELPKIL